MRWDPVVTAGLAAELTDILRGFRLKGIFLDHGGETLHAYFREATLLADLSASRSGVEILEAVEPPQDVKAFPCRLSVVESLPDERVLVFVLPRVRGRSGALRIILELAPNWANASLVEGDTWTVRHVLTGRGGPRKPRIGHPYPRSEPTRSGWDSPLDLGDWLALLEPEDPERREKKLVRNVAFTSPINARSLVGGHSEGSHGEVRSSLEAGYRLWLRLRDICHQAGETQSTREAFLLDCPWGRQPYPVPLPGYSHGPLRSLLDAVTETRRSDGTKPVLVPSLWMGALSDALEAARRRQRRLSAELAGAPDPEELQNEGDLILAHLDRVPRGAASVELPGWYGGTVTVPLDPSLSPHENAQLRYEKAGRGKRARQRLPGLIQEQEAHVARLLELSERARTGHATTGEIREALPDAQRVRTGGKRGAPVTLPYRRYRTTGGRDVWVGRNSKFNDELTFKHARPNDIWLHARHAGGAHVILRWTGDGAPPPRDLQEAAILAALHSKARTSGTVPVDWTRRKYVRKPRKAPPGRVQADRVSTVFVEPEPSLLERLRES